MTPLTPATDSVTVCDMTLHQYMEQAGLVDREVAAALGVSRSCIAQIRAGDRQPSLTLAVKIMDWSKGAVTPHDLVRK